MASTISGMEKNMREHQTTVNKHMETLKKQQDKLESLKGPEDFSAFMAEQGLTPDDIQRGLSGDEDFMKQIFEKAIGNLETDELKTSMKSADQVLSVVDQFEK